MTGFVIPFTGLARQHNTLREEILAATDAVLSSGVLMSGEWTQKFEQWLCQRNRVEHAITCHSGTQALEFIAEFYRESFSSLGLTCTIAVPALTYPATANAFVRQGWGVEFVDVDECGIMDLSGVPDQRIGALVLVGLYGAAITNIGYFDSWRRFLGMGVTVFEDAAQHWLSAGCTRIGRATAISFDPTKNLPASGNGGAVLTADADFAQWCRSQRQHGLPGHNSAGTNSRMSELDCAHLMVRTRHLDRWQERRRSIANYYRAQLRNLPVRCLVTDDNATYHSFHKFVIDLDARDLLYAHLARAGVETKVHYSDPISDLGVLRQFGGPNMLSRAHALSRRVLSLPIYPELSDTEAEYIMNQVQAFFS